jgi:small ligand-binding sensory domain FIST
LTTFFHAAARADDWRDAVRVVGDRLAADRIGAGRPVGGLGLIYVTEAFGPHLTDMATTLRERLGVIQWTGCSGLGLVARDGEIHDGGAVSVLVAPFDGADISPVPTLLDAERAGQRAVGTWAKANGPVFGIYHADPRNGAVEDIVRALVDTAPSGAFAVGGLTPLSEKPVQVAGTMAAAGGVSGVMLSGRIPVAVAISQGCLPVGPTHVVTGARGSIVAELDHRPALDVLKDDIGEVLARDLRRIAGYIHAALPVGGSDTGAYTVRNLVGVDPRAGLIAVGADLAPGDRLMFVRRDPANAQKDFAERLDELKKRVAGRTVLGGLYISCVARGRSMFGDKDGEVRMIKDALGDFPLTGFFANGEICGSRLYGYTGVMTVFLDRA